MGDAGAGPGPGLVLRPAAGAGGGSEGAGSAAEGALGWEQRLRDFLRSQQQQQQAQQQLPGHGPTDGGTASGAALGRQPLAELPPHGVVPLPPLPPLAHGHVGLPAARAGGSGSGGSGGRGGGSTTSGSAPGGGGGGTAPGGADSGAGRGIDTADGSGSRGPDSLTPLVASHDPEAPGGALAVVCNRRGGSFLLSYSLVACGCEDCARRPDGLWTCWTPVGFEEHAGVLPCPPERYSLDWPAGMLLPTVR